MANDLTLRPVKLDTAMGSPAGFGMTVSKVMWVAPTTLAHTFNIHDGSSGTKTLLTGSASAADVSGIIEMIFPVPVRWKNFQLSAISSGVLYIFGR